jgi:hypothetical protein
LTNAGGLLGGVATFQLASPGGALQTIAGVLSSRPVPVATIPVDDDVPQNRFTGYAVANPGSSSITIKAQMVNADGTLGPRLNDITLAPGEQLARFFFEDPNTSGSNMVFQGSVVLIGQGAAFSVVALVQNQGLFTAIPVIPAKAPHIN